MRFVLALFAAVGSLGAPNQVPVAPLICIDPGHEKTPDLSLERIGPGSSTYKIKDGGGAPARRLSPSRSGSSCVASSASAATAWR